MTSPNLLAVSAICGRFKFNSVEINDIRALEWALLLEVGYFMIDILSPGPV